MFVNKQFSNLAITLFISTTQVYQVMHRNQTYSFVKSKMSKWCKLDHAELTIMEALDTLSNFLDECDPDVDIPNAIHAYQTAEGEAWWRIETKISPPVSVCQHS